MPVVSICTPALSTMSNVGGLNMYSKQPYNKLQQSICDISANLSPVEGLMENISSFQSSHHSTPIKEGNQTGDSPSEYTSFKPMIDPSKTITPNLSSTEISFYGDSSINEAETTYKQPSRSYKKSDGLIKEAETTHKQQSWQQNDRSRMKSNNERPVKITVLGDSITKHIKADSLADSLEAHVEKNSQVYTLDIASSLAPTVESDIVLLHIGTNHLKRESADVTIKKIRKLEDQLAANKKVKQVILSSIVHRDDCPRKRIHLVNTALEISAERQGWTYLSNKAISQRSLSSDKVHLNHHGVKTLTNNFCDALSCVTHLIRNLSHFQKIKCIEII